MFYSLYTEVTQIVMVGKYALMTFSERVQDQKESQKS